MKLTARILALLLMAVMLFGVVACGGKTEEPAATTTVAVAEGSTNATTAATEAYRLTTPALFETTMKLKYSETSVDDIIRAGIIFDIARLFNTDPGTRAALFCVWHCRVGQVKDCP